MSILTIRNEFLSASIRTHGAELCSVQSLKSGREFLWQGDESVWDGQSPLLFPVIGRVKGGRYRLGDCEYAMPMHGFAKDSDFEVRTFYRNFARNTVIITFRFAKPDIIMSLSLKEIKNFPIDALRFSV